MKRYHLTACIFLLLSSVEAQVPKDSMPVVKPSLTDTAILRKPTPTGDNMPVANPDELPVQNGAIATPPSQNSRSNGHATRPRKKKK